MRMKWAEDVHDEHTIESYMKENATHIAHISVNAIKKCGGEWDDNRKEAALEGLIEAYTNKIREIQEMDGAMGIEDGDIQPMGPDTDDRAGKI